MGGHKWRGGLNARVGPAVPLSCQFERIFHFSPPPPTPGGGAGLCGFFWGVEPQFSPVYGVPVIWLLARGLLLKMWANGPEGASYHVSVFDFWVSLGRAHSVVVKGPGPGPPNSLCVTERERERAS